MPKPQFDPTKPYEKVEKKMAAPAVAEEQAVEQYSVPKRYGDLDKPMTNKRYLWMLKAAQERAKFDNAIKGRIADPYQQGRLDLEAERLKIEREKLKNQGTSDWRASGDVDSQGRMLMFNQRTGETRPGTVVKQKPGSNSATKPVRVEYMDEGGNLVQEFVTPEPGKKIIGKPKPSKAAAEPKPVRVDTIDDEGNPIQKFVIPKEGDTYGGKPAAPDKSKAKAQEEAKYRYNILQNNAKKLKGLVKKHGTVAPVGPEGIAMDKLIYEMAIDYAKMVDPESVAREGEVASAQKYMLPIRNEFMGVKGAGIRNKTADAAIDDYMSSLNDRLKARGMEVPGGNTGTVRVRNSAGETYEIPAADVPAAEKDGFKVVQ